MVSAMPTLLNPAPSVSADTDPEARGLVGELVATPRSRGEPFSDHRSGAPTPGSFSFAACPRCNRRVPIVGTQLQRHDVPFLKRRSPKVAEPCPAADLRGNTRLEA